MEPKVIFEDEEILVLDKPTGMTVNRADTTKGERTVQDWVEEYLKVEHVERVEKVEKEKITSTTFTTSSTFSTFLERAGIVHRLDKETSGVLLVAKTPEAFENLQDQFKNRLVRKTYLALVHGLVKPQEGEINIPVGRLPWNRKRFGIIADGRSSETSYKVIRNYTLPARNATHSVAGRDANSYTLLELYPATGRTHQIRVHLKYLGFPIVSDALYGGRKRAREDRRILPRMFLHARELSIQHPATGQQLSFASNLPADLEHFLSLCRK